MEKFNDKYKIGLKIKSARQEKGWTLERLGEKLGLSKSSVHQVEVGKSSYSYLTLKKFAEALDKPIKYFIELDDIGERAVSDDMAQYKAYSPDVQKINDLLLEHPETRNKILNYLESYSKGNKANLSGVGGLLDALSNEQLNEIVKELPNIIIRLKNS